MHGGGASSSVYFKFTQLLNMPKAYKEVQGAQAASLLPDLKWAELLAIVNNVLIGYCEY